MVSRDIDTQMKEFPQFGVIKFHGYSDVLMKNSHSWIVFMEMYSDQHRFITNGTRILY